MMRRIKLLNSARRNSCLLQLPVTQLMNGQSIGWVATSLEGYPLPVFCIVVLGI